ncbi:MAG TPA: hypothetical protein VLH94_01605 [Spirochaetia bacterium]|nr:hypothetical protein [Spirochaetia bacterium]
MVKALYYFFGVVIIFWVTLTLAYLASLPLLWVILFLAIMESLPIFWRSKVIQRSIFINDAFIGGLWFVMILIVCLGDLMMFLLVTGASLWWLVVLLPLVFLFVRERIRGMRYLLAVN